MKNSALLTIFICAVLIAGANISSAQNAPVTTAATIGNALPGAVDAPITVTGFTSIGAVSLSIDYDYAVMHFTGGTPNPLMTSFPIGDQDLGTGYHRLTMGWYGSALSLPDGSAIMTLHFTYISGISPLTWFDNGPSCEYTDAIYNVLNDIPTSDYYINGNICGAIATPGPISGNDTLCEGATGVAYSIASLSNATGYNWSVPPGAIIVTGQGTNSIVVDFPIPSGSGAIAVYGTNACGSGPSSELAILVGQLPVANAGNDTIIPYGTYTILHAANGGSGTFSYHWSPEELLIDPNVQTPQTVNLTLTTIFTVLVTNQLTLCQGSDAVMVTITGGPLSINPIAVPSAICQGESAQLFSNAGGGSGNYSYMWTANPPGSPPWSSTLANPVVSPESSTIYELMLTDGFNTTSGIVILSVSNRPTATISGGDTLCGDSEFASLPVDLTGVAPWSFTYTYGSTSVYVINVLTTPYYIIASEPGDYTITATEDANCTGTSYGTAIVVKYPVPAKPEITIYLNELLSSSCCGNQWYLNGDTIDGATGQTYQVTVSGQYFVIVTLNTCSSEPSDTVDMVVGIRENGAESSFPLNCLPNPFSNFTTISYTLPFEGKVILEIFNILGVKVTTLLNERQTTGDHMVTFDTFNLPSGVYTATLRIKSASDESIRTIKLVSNYKTFFERESAPLVAVAVARCGPSVGGPRSTVFFL